MKITFITTHEERRRKTDAIDQAANEASLRDAPREVWVDMRSSPGGATRYELVDNRSGNAETFVFGTILDVYNAILRMDKECDKHASADNEATSEDECHETYRDFLLSFGDEWVGLRALEVWRIHASLVGRIEFDEFLKRRPDKSVMAEERRIEARHADALRRYDAAMVKYSEICEDLKKPNRWDTVIK